MSEVERIGLAFYCLGRVLKCKGRRYLNAELGVRARWIRPEDGSRARRVQMTDRAYRRANARANGREFRPVYGHAIEAPDHKAHIEAMKSSASA